MNTSNKGNLNSNSATDSSITVVNITSMLEPTHDGGGKSRFRWSKEGGAASQTSQEMLVQLNKKQESQNPGVQE